MSFHYIAAVGISKKHDGGTKGTITTTLNCTVLGPYCVFARVSIYGQQQVMCDWRFVVLQDQSHMVLVDRGVRQGESAAAAVVKYVELR
jgi:hypothetical protein